MAGTARDERLATIRTLAERVAGTFNLEVFDVQLRRESIGWVLRVILDRPSDGSAVAAGAQGIEQGVSIEECRLVSQDLAPLLDVELEFDQPYTLEVSSPGLDRPLRRVEDYRRFDGRLAAIVVGQPVDGQRHFRGRLRGVEDDVVTLEGDRGRLHRIPFATITRARLEVEF